MRDSATDKELEFPTHEAALAIVRALNNAYFTGHGEGRRQANDENRRLRELTKDVKITPPPSNLDTL